MANTSRRNWFERWIFFSAGNKKGKSGLRSRFKLGRRLGLETLEDRTLLATNITIVVGAAGAGNLDQFLSAADGTITTADDPGDTAATLSTGALAGVGASVPISIAADSGITFNDLGTLNLPTATGVQAAFSCGTGAIAFANLANTITTAGGALLLGAGTSMTVANLSSSGGDISLSADTMSIVGAVNAGAGIVTLTPTTAGRNIELGANPSAGKLGLAQGDLNQITAAVLRIGAAASSGNITITAGITAPAGWSTLHLASNGSIQEVAAPLTVTNLALEAAGDVSAVQLTNDVSVLAGRAGNLSAQFQYIDANAFTVGSVDGIDGISTNNGSIGLAILGTQTLTVSTSVASHGGFIEFTTDGMDLQPGSTTDAGSGGVVLRNNDIVPVDLGAASTPGTLGLTAAALDTVVTSGILVVGSVNADNVTISAPIAPAHVGIFELQTGGSVTELAGATITVPNLAINAIAAVTLDEANAVTTLAGEVASMNPFTFTNAGDLTIGTLDGIAGVFTENDTLSLRTLNGSLTVNSDVLPGAGALQITVGGRDSTFTNAALIETNMGNPITIAADRMILAPGSALDADTGATVELEATTNGRPIDVGSNADPTGSLNLSADELNTIVTTGTLQIGHGSEADVALSANISLANIGSLAINTHGAILDANDPPTAMNDIAVPTLHLNAGTGIGASAALEVTVSTLTVSNSTSGDIQVVNLSGDVSARGSNTAPGGKILLTDLGGALTVDAGNLNTNQGNITLGADTMTLTGIVGAGNATVTLQQAGTTLRNIDLGSLSSGSLGLTDTELDQVAAGLLRIGRTDNDGSISVTGRIDAETHYGALALVTGGVIAAAANSLLSAPSVVLQAEDNVVLPSGSSIQAAGAVTIDVGFGDQDNDGGSFSLQGQIVGTPVMVQGSSAGDTFTVDTTGSGALTIAGQGGRDTFNITPSTTTPITLAAGQPGSGLHFDSANLAGRIAEGQVTAAGRQALRFDAGTITSVQINNAAAVNTFYGPDTTDRGSLSGLTAQERFVEVLYLNALGRVGAKSELDAWVNILNGAGGSPTLVARSIEGSQEARDHLVRTWYQTFLGRAAAGGEEQVWVSLLLQGNSEESVLSSILASNEFFSHAQTMIGSGTAKERFVQALYLLLLNRTGSGGEVASWVNAMSSLDQRNVALAFLNSSEYRGYLIEAYYEILLHRPSDQAGFHAWINSGLDALGMRTAFEGAQEFFSNG